jgi:hypothetical protein
MDALSTPVPSVARLLQLGGASTSKCNPIDWPAVQRRLGTVLPVDYRELAEFGAARAGDFLGVFVPGSTNPNLDLFVAVGSMLGALHDLKREQGTRACPYPLWFEPTGLLPWGCSDNGDGLYWLTRGHPDQWTVVIGEARGPKYEEFPLSMSEFLAGFVSGEITTTVFPRNVCSAPAVALIEPRAR